MNLPQKWDYQPNQEGRFLSRKQFMTFLLGLFFGSLCHAYDPYPMEHPREELKQPLGILKRIEKDQAPLYHDHLSPSEMNRVNQSLPDHREEKRSKGGGIKRTYTYHTHSDPVGVHQEEKPITIKRSETDYPDGRTKVKLSTQLPAEKGTASVKYKQEMDPKAGKITITRTSVKKVRDQPQPGSMERVEHKHEEVDKRTYKMKGAPEEGSSILGEKLSHEMTHSDTTKRKILGVKVGEYTQNRQVVYEPGEKNGSFQVEKRKTTLLDADGPKAESLKIRGRVSASGSESSESPASTASDQTLRYEVQHRQGLRTNRLEGEEVIEQKKNPFARGR